jgi:hypothetical protein
MHGGHLRTFLSFESDVDGRLFNKACTPALVKIFFRTCRSIYFIKRKQSIKIQPT